MVPQNVAKAIPSNNKLLKRNIVQGQFDLDGIAPAPRGLPQIDVTFDIDANGILNVSAKDKATGKEQSITITASSGLAREEIDQLVKEAEEHAEEDAKRRELIEAHNLADNSIYQAEKMITEHADKIEEQLKSELESKIIDLKSLLSDESVDAQTIHSSVESLGQSLQQIGEAIYSPSNTDDPIETEPISEEGEKTDSNNDEDENTVEGEYRET